MQPPSLDRDDRESIQSYQERHRRNSLPIQQPHQHSLQIAHDPIDQQYLQALQQHDQNIQEQGPILEQFIRNIQQLLQHQVQAAENPDPQSLQVQPVSLHHIYHPPLPKTQSQTTQSMIQSQDVPTTATTEIQAGSNSPQISHPPDKRTSEGDKQPDKVPGSATGTHAVDSCNASKSWTGIAQSYSTFGQVIMSIETIFLQHPGHMTLHDVPISMDSLDDFCHRYTANTFQLLSVVAPHPGPFKRRSKVLILSDQGYESIPLIDKTTVILFIRLQERHERHWVLVKADFSTHTLTYYDPIHSISDENDPWLTQTCSEVEDMLWKSVGHHNRDRVRFPSPIIGAMYPGPRTDEDSGPLVWQEVEMQTKRHQHCTLANTARRRQISWIYHALRDFGKVAESSSPGTSINRKERIIELKSTTPEPRKVRRTMGASSLEPCQTRLQINTSRPLTYDSHETKDLSDEENDNNFKHFDRDPELEHPSIDDYMRRLKSIKAEEGDY